MSNHRILIVASDRMAVQELAKRLSSLGYEVTGSLTSGEEALVQAGEQLPDIVLMDIQLAGEMDGIQAASQIKDRYQIPVVLLSAEAGPEILTRAGSAQPAGYILKPFTDLQLYTTLAVARQRASIERKLRSSEIKFRSVYWQSPVGIVLLDNQYRLLDANPSCLRLFGVDHLAGLLGYRVIDDWTIYEQTRGRKIIGKTVQFELELDFERSEIARLLHSTRTGTVSLRCLVTPWVGAQEQVEGYLLHIQDITEQRMAEERIRHDALHDALTNLPNRAYFIKQLDHLLDRRKQDASYLAAILFMDLDRFKFINDTLGHAAGDQVLNIIARRLRNNVKSSDFVARFGGDEFSIILDGIKGPQEALAVAERLRREIAKPVSLGGTEVFTNTSIGISFTSPTTTQSDDLIREADIAMYRAKNNGRAQSAVFDREMYAVIQQSILLEKELRLAIDRQEFVLHYQPIIYVENRAISGLAVLLRWNHPVRGLVYPSEFIPVTEDTGLIIPLGEWVIQNACRQLSAWREAGYTSIRISINISPKQLQNDNLVDTIEKVLRANHLPPYLVGLEIKGTDLAGSADLPLEVLKSLQALGLVITIDNLGNSYTSLDRLKGFPADILKLNRSFLQNIPQSQEDTAIVEAIIHMAHVMNLRVVAEGVESEAQLKALQPQCDEIQGWVASPPLPAHEVTRLLRLGKLGLSTN